MLPIAIGKTNPHDRQWLRLLRSAGRKRSRLFLIEGEREVLRVTTVGVAMETVVFNQTATASGKKGIAFSDTLISTLFACFPSMVLQISLNDGAGFRLLPCWNF